MRFLFFLVACCLGLAGPVAFPSVKLREPMQVNAAHYSCNVNHSKQTKIGFVSHRKSHEAMKHVRSSLDPVQQNLHPGDRECVRRYQVEASKI